MSQTFTAESVTALLELVGAKVEPAGAVAVAAALNAQVPAAGKVYATLPFEAEPADYLRISAEEAP